jgi:hypothetical protein
LIKDTGDFTPIIRVNDFITAEVFSGVLKQHGINVALKEDILPTANIHEDEPSEEAWGTLLVEKHNAETAKRILKEFINSKRQ